MNRKKFVNMKRISFLNGKPLGSYGKKNTLFTKQEIATLGKLADYMYSFTIGALSDNETIELFSILISLNMLYDFTDGAVAYGNELISEGYLDIYGNIYKYKTK